MHKNYTLLTHGLSRSWGFNRDTYVDEINEMYATTVRRSEMLERIATGVQEIVKTQQTLLGQGIKALQPGVDCLEAVVDHGDIDDIAGIFVGSSKHIVNQVRKLGRSVIYKICHYLHDTRIPLQKSYVALHRWNEKEEEMYSEWRSIDADSLNTPEELSEAHCCLGGLVRDQRKLLMSLRDEFANAIDADNDGGKLLHLLARCAQGNLAVQQLRAQNQLEQENATVEAGENALRDTIHPEVNAHRSTNISLVEYLGSITSFKMCKILIDFRAKVHGEQKHIADAIGVE